MRWLLILVLALAGCGEQPVVTPGVDYSLPSWSEPVDDAGYVDGDGQYKNMWVYWADLEPERGVYDFSSLEAKLNSYEAQGKRPLLHLLSGVCGSGGNDHGVNVPVVAPAWAIPDDPIQLGWEFNLEYIPLWRPDLAEAFNELVRELGRRGYADRIGLAYVQGISPSRGEEFWLEPWMVRNLEAHHGWSADVAEQWIKGRMDAYAEAFGRRRVMWVGRRSIWHYSGAEYDTMAVNLIHYGWSLGIGSGTSIVEFPNTNVVEYCTGQWVDEHGHAHTDESIPPIVQSLYLGEENEEYTAQYAWRFGPVSGNKHRHWVSTMKALQQQVRYLWTHSSADTLNPPLTAYARASLGKRVTDSPDAWAFLITNPIGVWITPARAINNYERWLYQRDAPGGQTVPVNVVRHEYCSANMNPDTPGAFVDYMARSTDLANEQSSMFFDLDSRFQTAQPELKVTVVDSLETSWHVDYYDASGTLRSTPTYRGPGDGQVRTVTFDMGAAVFTRDTDFTIVCEGPGDVWVQWVRLVNKEAPWLR